MATWIRKPQEVKGDYRFDGSAYMTPGVRDALAPEELLLIVSDLAQFAAGGEADYLQVFESSDGRVLWCIDDRTHWTMLLPSEY